MQANDCKNLACPERGSARYCFGQGDAANRRDMVAGLCRFKGVGEKNVLMQGHAVHARHRRDLSYSALSLR